MQLNPATLFVAIGFVLATRYAAGTLPPLTWGEGVAISLFGLLLWWCSRPSRSGRLDTLGDAIGVDETRQSIPFRLGKALNRIFRRRVHPVVTDDLR
jgi:hypothetical protein